MRHQIRKCWSLAALALLCFTVSAFPQDGMHIRPSSKIQKALSSGAVQSTPQKNASVAAPVSQKLLVLVPESPATLVFAADILGLAVLYFLFRQRLVRGNAGTGTVLSAKEGCQ